MEKDELLRQVEEAGKALDAWPDKEKELAGYLPETGLCAQCWLRGHKEQPDHYILILCPSGSSAVLHSYTWRDGILAVKGKYMLAPDALEESVGAIVQRVLDGVPDPK